jgi:hypothetical protein
VKGHQDVSTQIDNLDIYAKLNIEMDTMAKAFLQEAQTTKRNFVTIHEPWSLWIDKCKIGTDLDAVVYDTFHSPNARKYWANKHQVDEEVINDVNWPAVQDALSTSPLSKRLFITKHAAGMCGVGKFMARWKKRDTSACPRCGAFEDATHVWKCRGEDADRVWKQSLDHLKDWMASHDTDPDLANLLLDMLQSWRDDTPCPGQIPYGLQLLVTRQSELGGQALLEGRLSFEWEASQQAYLTFIKSKRTGWRWVSQLIKKLWAVAWDLWEHRNGILHEQTTNRATEQDTVQLNLRVQSAYSKLLGITTTLDRHLTRMPLSDILQKSCQYKRVWLSHAEVVIKSAQFQVRTAQEQRRQDLELMRCRL